MAPLTILRKLTDGVMTDTECLLIQALGSPTLACVPGPLGQAPESHDMRPFRWRALNSGHQQGMGICYFLKMGQKSSTNKHSPRRKHESVLLN